MVAKKQQVKLSRLRMLMKIRNKYDLSKNKVIELPYLQVQITSVIESGV